MVATTSSHAELSVASWRIRNVSVCTRARIHNSAAYAQVSDLYSAFVKYNLFNYTPFFEVRLADREQICLINSHNIYSLYLLICIMYAISIVVPSRSIDSDVLCSLARRGNSAVNKVEP